MEPLKTALVTGAANRIGRAIALDLGAQGWQVAIHYNTSQKEAAQTVSDIEEAGGTANAIQVDLSDLDAVKALLPACTERLGAPSCLINNASLFEHDRIERLKPENWHAHLDINLRAPVFLAQSFAANLPEGTEGVIINLLDQRVWKLTPDFFSYTISKSALWSATRTLAQGLAPRIRVNAIGPGPTLANSRQTSDAFERQQKATLLQRGAGLDEICSAVRFILDAPSMTGQMIALDGGQHLAWRTPDIFDNSEKT
jgi:NAD(P)-dependent dehydrogenase (short-subunit alcohol dehydrogenase family)